MLKGYTTPRTPAGTSGLAPRPPWHYAANCLAVEFVVDPAVAESFLPEGLDRASGRAAIYFAEWQFATDDGREYVDPIRSQYRESILLLAAKYNGPAGEEDVAYCPFIFVDQDTALMRGLVQGWPKQIGSVLVTRASSLKSPAAPMLDVGGQFGASLSAKDRRLADAAVTLREKTDRRPSPGFAHAINVRYFPDLAAGRHDHPAVHELVQLKSRAVQFSDIWTGDASLTLFDHPYLELPKLKPVRIDAGYYFSFAFTVDDLVKLRDLPR